jgi:hypothetical protein
MLLEQKATAVDGEGGKGPSKFENMFKLHLISALIPTSSTDVERTFSHHKQILRVKRTRLHVKNIDTRVRGVEQVRPLLLEKGYKWAGQPSTVEPESLHPYQLYLHLLNEDKLSDFLTISLHCALAPDKNIQWLEMYENEFEGIEADEEVVAADDLPALISSDSVEEAVNEEVERLARLLAGEQVE